MKQFKLLSVVLILVIFASSCNKTPQDKISGKWDIDKIENSTMTEDVDIEALNEMNADVLANEVFEFTAEKVSRVIPEVTEGTWEINETGTTLTIDWGEGDLYSPHTFVVNTLTSDSLVIEEDFEVFSITTTFIKK